MPRRPDNAVDPTTMPEISRFFGIVIKMFYDEHNPPHFHVYYNEFKATVDIRTCEVIEGNLPRRQQKLTLAWAELHQEELTAKRGSSI